MIFSWIIGLLIFCYAGYMMYRHIKNSKKGKCAVCELKKSCSSVNAGCSTREP
ncbi:FeoB-associated Cys-rich membrane protein [Bacillus infantis]|uniref:FeoB-associated Cys-rich membrane protein n=1 Tax=Bacillus infantis TaxID=324767 RepID=UPI001CD71B9B|nr:FeoB-associated Cys-rich membrane protein [Bacillus infantis]MCA1042523.1 FeoB-associated Cys-rich membrane protein [Bacillus infantis]